MGWADIIDLSKFVAIVACQYGGPIGKKKKDCGDYTKTQQPSPFYKSTPSAVKSVLLTGVASLECCNLIVFYLISACDIWPYKKGDLWWE